MSIFCAGPDLSSVPSTEMSENIFSDMMGEPSPKYSSRKFFAQAAKPEVKPALSTNVFSGE